MSEIEFINLKKNYSDYSDQIVDFYSKHYKSGFSNVALQNSAIVCVALFNNKIVGAVRAISDLSRHSFVVDLIVDKNHRRGGIGTKLLKNIVSELKKESNRKIGLTTEPCSPWLKEFYMKNGFKELEDGAYLEK